MSDLPSPKYSLWECMAAALALATRALEEVRALARIPGPQGKQGIPGRDGLGFDAIEPIDDDGEYGFKFVAAGQVVKECRFRKPVANFADVYRGIWKPGDYRRGEIVTYGGSAFLAKADTEDKPEKSDAWVLWVKRGRDGRDVQPECATGRPVKLK
jgi:integrin beta 3